MFIFVSVLVLLRTLLSLVFDCFQYATSEAWRLNYVKWRLWQVAVFCLHTAIGLT
jgi:hypothetical protein